MYLSNLKEFVLLYLIIFAVGHSQNKGVNEDFHDINNEDYSYDHNSILGPYESERFNKMSAEDSKSNFKDIIDKMDINFNGMVELTELKLWIKNVFINIINDDVEKQWREFNAEREKIDFQYYVLKTYGEKRSVDHLKLIKLEERRWKVADLDQDGLLNKTELFRFLHPEEFKDMKPLIAQETLEEMDQNNDSVVDINEYLSDIFPAGRDTKEEWIRNERQNFGIDRDLNKDGVMDKDEIQNWLMPDTYDRVDAEAQHLMDLADKDKNQILSKSEMLENYKVFVGSRQPDSYFNPDLNHEDL